MTINIKVYNNGEMVDVEQVFDMKAIKESKELFEKCCIGEYPTYVLTEEGRKFVEEMIK